jgi:hypothetical protein
VYRDTETGPLDANDDNGDAFFETSEQAAQALTDDEIRRLTSRKVSFNEAFRISQTVT